MDDAEGKPEQRAVTDLAALGAVLAPLYGLVGADLGAATVLLAMALLAAGTGGEPCKAEDVARLTSLGQGLVQQRIGRLRALGLVDGEPGACRLSPDGRRALQDLWTTTASTLLAGRTAPLADKEKPGPALALIRSSHS